MAALAQQAGFNVLQLAALRTVSARTLRRQFQRQFGLSPKAWMERQRVEAAEDMLARRFSVKAVAHALGFKDVAHFCHEFKRHRGLCPGRYQALLLGWPEPAECALLDPIPPAPRARHIHVRPPSDPGGSPDGRF